MTTEEIIAWKNFPSILEKARSKANRRYPSILEIDDDAEFGEHDINEAKRDIFIEGYLEAEKDINKELMDIMADVRDKQEKSMYADYDIHIDTSNISDTSLAYVFKGDRVIDLLTWEDIRTIINIEIEMIDDPEAHPEWMEEQPFYEEVLRRFNKAREENK